MYSSIFDKRDLLTTTIYKMEIRMVSDEINFLN